MNERQGKLSKSAELPIEPADHSRIIIDISMDGFCRVGLDGKLLEVNRALCDITGYSREELLRMNGADLDAVKTMEEVSEIMDKIVKQGYDRLESKHRRKDGTIIDVEVSIQYCNSGDDEFFFAFIRDITHLKRSMDKVRKSEEVYRNLCNNIPGMVYRGLPGWLADIKSNSEEICGYSPEELNSNKVNWLDIIHPDDRERVGLEALQMNEKPCAMVQEYRIIAKDQSVRWVEDHKASTFTDGGVFDGVDGVVFDVTSRKKDEENLRSSIYAMDNCGGGLAILNMDGIIQYVNGAFAQMHGYTTDEMLGDHMSNYHLPEHIEEVRAAIDQVVTTGYFEGELWHARRDGGAFPGYMTSTLVEDDLGNATGIIGTLQDITERKMVEDELKASEARFHILSDVAVEGIVIHEDENILDINKRYTEMFGYNVDELRAVGIVGTVIPEYRERLANNIASGYEGVYEVIALRKDGTTFPVEVQVKQLQLNGRTIRVGSIRDISVRKQLETERAIYKEDLLQAQRHAYLGCMGAIVAHELNQPLTKLNILLDRAVEELENSGVCTKALVNVKDGLSEAKNAKAIIQQFRRYSRDSVLRGYSKVNVGVIAERIVGVLSERAKEANIHISMDGLDDLPEIDANTKALEQVFLNLIQNAIQAIDDRGVHRLDITGKYADGYIELCFADDCRGIASENLDKIFDPFFSTKTEDGGMGLGLDIVQQILMSFGGQIGVKSKLGTGTTFHVTLPVNDFTESLG
ncbi:MAG: PAS domain S-box protein [Sedimentisphaerales bacterium]|nr:PAS domain S-box protein [Sedimentisphaerales bacterium]